MGKLRVFIVIGVALILCAAWCEAGEKPGTGGMALFENNCGKCHGLERSKSKNKSKNEWETTVFRMKKNGATITADEANLIIKYLSEAYGKPS
jgi:mono/diheme cytochrome c family protein